MLVPPSDFARASHSFISMKTVAVGRTIQVSPSGPGVRERRETKEQTRADVRFGIEPWFRYFQKVAAFPQMTIPGEQIDEMINIINDGGAGVIGTPEQARAQVQRLWDQSGGFGCMLQMGHEWANPAATTRSAELFAAEVIPYFQGQAQPTLDAAARASEVRDDLAQTQLQAIDHMTKKYQDEVDSK